MSAATLEPVADATASAAPGASARGRVGALLLGAMAGALVAARWETAVACVVAAGLGAAWTGAGRPSRTWLATIGGGMAIAMALNAWLTPGRPLPLPALFGRAASREGLALGGLLALRLGGAALAVHGLRAAWPGERAADEAARWLAPLERVRVPVRELRAVLGLALRLAPLLRDEAKRIARLQTLRAGRAPRGALERLARARATVVPALVCALERAEQVALALEARHWRARAVAKAAPAGAWGWAGLLVFALAVGWRAR